jgi:predicted DNA-binding transcriptional regulator
MRVEEFLKAVIADKPAAKPTRDYSPPAGWYTVEQIRAELNLAHTRNASSRAYDMFRRGMLERQAHQFKCKTGQCHMAYIYRPVAPHKTISEAVANVFTMGEEKVPKGWVRLINYAVNTGVSDVAVRGRVARAGLKPRYFKTSRGVSGLHQNAYYWKPDLDRLYR